MGKKYVLNMDYEGPSDINLIDIFNNTYSNEIKKPLPKNSSCMQINTLRNVGNFPPLD